jgi:hypothetical protein
VDEVVEHHPDSCRRCGTLLRGDDPNPVRHQVLGACCAYQQAPAHPLPSPGKVPGVDL